MQNLLKKRLHPCEKKRACLLLLLSLLTSTACIVAGQKPEQNTENDNSLNQKAQTIMGSGSCQDSPASNQRKLRLYMEDKDGNTILPSKTTSLRMTDLAIDEKSVVVIDSETGKAVPGAKVNVEIKQDSPTKLHINPNYQQLSQTSKNQRIPNATSLLLDESLTSATVDSEESRISASIGWLYSRELFNEDKEVGPLDALQVLLLKNGTVGASSFIFNSLSEETQVLPTNSNYKLGFITTNETNKDLMVLKLNRSSGNRNANGKSPLFEGIKKAAISLKKVGQHEQGWHLNPGIIALSASRGLEGKKRQDNLSSALEQLSKKSKKDTIGIPVLHITFPKPKDEKQESWDSHLNDLCNIAKKSSESSNTFFGNVFQIPKATNIRPERTFQEYIAELLRASTHALKGFHEIEIQWTASNLQTGKKYFLEFSLSGKWNGTKTKEASRTRIAIIGQ